MNLLDKILLIFTPKSSNDIVIVEKFSTLSISFEIDNFTSFDFNKLDQIFATIVGNDTFSLAIKIGDNDSIIANDLSEIEVFRKEIEDERKIIEEESIQLKFEISKGTNERINIYLFDEFQKFWQSTSLLNILSLLKTYRNNNNRNDFLLIENDKEQFQTHNIKFINTTDNSVSFLNSNISDNCHFGNKEELPFNPSYFKLLQECENIESNCIIDSLNRLCVLFSVVSIFDITSITETELYYKLNGYKSFEGRIDITNIDSSYVTNYYKIHDWIYSNDGNVDDKIGLARNIISLSFVENSLELADSVYLSIQSGYKAYLQENISKYIEIRNKIIDELSWVSQKSSEIIGAFLSNYQKSIFTFLSFFISVFILRFLKGGTVEEVFSKEVTVFSISFLLLSLIFMFFSIWNLNSEKSRLRRKYENIKNRYTDLLDENDIRRILKDDSEFNYEISFVEKRRNNYVLLWVITIIILISTIFCVSSYVNWSLILDWIKELINPVANNV